MRYKDARLIYLGLQDFLRGTKWLYRQDPEKLNNKMRELTYQLMDLKELDSKLTPLEMLDVRNQINIRKKQLSLDEITKDRRIRDKASFIKYITLNGWLLPARSGIALTLSTDSPFYIFRRKRVVCYEASSGKVFVTEKRYKEFLDVVSIYLKSIWIILTRLCGAIKDYNKNISKITNKKAWEMYLNISEK